MRNHLLRGAGALLLGLSAGCATPGLRLEILQPPVLLGNTQSVVQSTSGLVSTQPNGSFVSPLGMPDTSMTMIPTTRITNASPGPRLEFAPRSSSDCTLEDVCRRIQALEATRPSIRLAPQPERLPAPKLVPTMPPASCE